MSPYRERYHRKLNELKTLSEDLADQVSIAIEQSVVALQDANLDLSRDIIRNDQKVDDLGQEIENLCMELLALQQPMAKDLRMIVGVLKIGIDLERIGDLAVDVARAASQSKNEIQLNKLESIPRMAEIDRKMLSKAIEALINDDANLARQTTKWDYEIDGLYVKVRDKLLRLIIEKPEVLNDGISLLMVNRHLERIGDHICNICESIVYMVEAKREHLN